MSVAVDAWEVTVHDCSSDSCTLKFTSVTDVFIANVSIASGGSAGCTDPEPNYLYERSVVLKGIGEGGRSQSLEVIEHLKPFTRYEFTISGTSTITAQTKPGLSRGCVFPLLQSCLKRLKNCQRYGEFCECRSLGFRE